MDADPVPAFETPAFGGGPIPMDWSTSYNVQPHAPALDERFPPPPTVGHGRVPGGVRRPAKLRLRGQGVDVPTRAYTFGTQGKRRRKRAPKRSTASLSSRKASVGRKTAGPGGGGGSKAKTKEMAALEARLSKIAEDMRRRL